MIKKFAMGSLILILFLALGILESTPKAVAAEVEWITFGMNVPLSGAGAAGWGIPPLRAAKMRAKEANDAGGVTIGGKTYKFKIFAADNKYSVEGGRAFAEKLVYQEKGRYVCGVTGSGPCLGMQEVTERAKVLNLFSVWDRTSLGPNKPYSFRVYNLANELSIPTMNAVKKKYPDAKTIAFIAPNAPNGRDNAASEMELCPRYGWKTVADEYYEMGTTDFYPIVTKIKAKKPDIIDFANTGPSSAALIMKALYEVGWKGITFSATGQQAEAITEIAGKAATEGFIYGMGWDCAGPLVSPELRELAKKYEAKYKEPLVIIAAAAYAGADAIIRAMKKADSIDTTLVRDTLAEMKWEGILGPTHIGGEKSYGIKRVFVFPAIVSEVQNGKGVDIDKISFEVP